MENDKQLETKIKQLEDSLNYQIQQNVFLKEQLESIEKSSCWKLTAPYRIISDSIKNRIFFSTLKYLKQRFVWHFRHDFYLPIYSFGISTKKYHQQINQTFNKKITFSILVPLYNTPENFLREMLGSVIFQTYGNWELCLADGSDDKHNYVKYICEQAKQKDSRIKYKKLSRNGGISENTNACLEMATGEYISLFDHDDLLHPSALYYTMKAICEENAEFIYTDEIIFNGNKLHSILGTNFKPDFAPDYLNTCNYITHFSSFKKTLLSDNTKFDSECDGAQDYDMILKIVEKTKRIYHIKKCLYYWRASATSTAGSSSAKTYSTAAGKKALENHFTRIGISADVFRTGLANRYKITYPIQNCFVSIVISASSDLQKLRACLNSIKKSSYTNFEIIVVGTTEINEHFFKDDSKIKFIHYNKNNTLNYSASYNLGYAHSKGDYLLFFNDELEVISENWIEEMLMFSQKKNVGAVGGKIYSSNDRILNAGYIFGMKNKCVTSSHYLYMKKSNGYNARLFSVQNYSAVSMDCMMISRNLYDDLNGFDEKFGDSSGIDLCFRLRKAGYNIVWTPHAELCRRAHKKRSFEKKDLKLLLNVWKKQMTSVDSYYNPNLNLKIADFSVTGEIFPN